MRMHRLWVVYWVVGSMAFASPLYAADLDRKNSLTSELLMESRAGGRVYREPEDGRVRFFGTHREGAVAPMMKGQPASAQETSDAFISRYGELFGLREPSKEMRAEKVKKTKDDRSVLRYQQHRQGIPVVGGEMIVQTIGTENRILSAGGKVASDLVVDVAPAITPSAAQNTALALVSKHYGVDLERLSVSDPELWVYDPKVMGGPGRGQYLVWRMEVTPTETLPIREFVLIDAHCGSVALHFNQTDTALQREIYDADFTNFLPGSLVLSEGAILTGDTDKEKAYKYSGDTYNFYFNQHQRNSIDNAGKTLVSTVNYRKDPTKAYENAFWDGAQMVYGEGMVSDDAAAHEITHGVTESESRLFYYHQSGAINEALSDIWGEFIDLTNGSGNDSDAVRWQVGEDLPSGPWRDMNSPNLYGNPERMGDSTYYYCGTEDSGGVHYNSGIANKAAVLLTDGGSFNGYAIQKLSGGIPMVADLFYEVQANLLTSASDYQDLYNALIQAADNLGFSAADRQSVVDVVNATEMNQQPSGCPATDVPVCSSGATRALFSDDFENPNSGNWAISGTPASWYYPPNSHPYTGFDATYATSGIYNLWGDDIDSVGDYSISMTRDIALPSTGAWFFQFNHAYFLESNSASGIGYDGGVVEYSINRGRSWTDAGGLFTHNGYNRTISSSFSNPLQGRTAFSGVSNGYISSRLDLSSLAGKKVRFRFRIGTDEPSQISTLGWFIDDVSIFACAGAITVISPNGSESWTPGSRQTITWECNGDVGKNVRVELWKGDSLVRIVRRSVKVKADGTGSLNWRLPQRLEAGSDYTIRIVGKDSGVDVSDAPFTVVPSSR